MILGCYILIDKINSFKEFLLLFAIIKTRLKWKNLIGEIM